MNFFRSPKNKLLLAAAAVVALAALAPSGGVSAPQVARVLLAAVALGGLAWWLHRARKAGPSAAFAAETRLRVLSRTGLSQRCGMALVEADGRNYLVVFGDGFAELQEAAAAPAPGLAPPQRKGGAR